MAHDLRFVATLRDWVTADQTQRRLEQEKKAVTKAKAKAELWLRQYIESHGMQATTMQLANGDRIVYRIKESKQGLSRAYLRQGLRQVMEEDDAAAVMMYLENGLRTVRRPCLCRQPAKKPALKKKPSIINHPEEAKEEGEERNDDDDDYDDDYNNDDHEDYHDDDHEDYDYDYDAYERKQEQEQRGFVNT